MDVQSKETKIIIVQRFSTPMLITLLFTIEKAWEKQSVPTGRIDSENIHTGILVSLYKEGNSVIRNNMGETGWYCAKRNKQNRETKTASYVLPLICGTKNKNKNPHSWEWGK